jgi:hypothetical protein
MSIKEEISEWGKLKEYNEKFFMGIRTNVNGVKKKPKKAG